MARAANRAESHSNEERLQDGIDLAPRASRWRRQAWQAARPLRQASRRHPARSLDGPAGLEEGRPAVRPAMARRAGVQATPAGLGLLSWPDATEASASNVGRSKAPTNAVARMPGAASKISSGRSLETFHTHPTNRCHRVLTHHVSLVPPRTDPATSSGSP